MSSVLFMSKSSLEVLLLVELGMVAVGDFSVRALSICVLLDGAILGLYCYLVFSEGNTNEQDQSILGGILGVIRLTYHHVRKYEKGDGEEG